MSKGEKHHNLRHWNCRNPGSNPSKQPRDKKGGGYPHRQPFNKPGGDRG